MKRELFGVEISQKSQSEFFSATDLVKAGNKWRLLNDKSPFVMSEYLRNKGTLEFIEELEANFGKVKINARGRGSHTWIHPLLFIDMALSISPKLKIETYKWLLDNLLKYRNNSGDSYKKMCGALFYRAKDKTNFRSLISNVAKQIKFECGVKNWEIASESQLQLRDRIQDNIYLLCDVLTDVDKIIDLSVKKAKELIK
ncbi:MAG: KilA-N domain-containing protein [Saprospiraceae bacterium]